MRWRRSCVHGKSSLKAASTALSAFSAACCAWKPTTASARSGSAQNLRTASASSRALRRSKCASSSSGCDKDAALAKRAVHECAGNAFATRRLVLGDHHDIDRDAQRRERVSQTHHLLQLALDFGLDHEEVEIAVVSRVPARTRSEQHDTRGRACGRSQSPARVLDLRLADHGRTVSATDRYREVRQSQCGPWVRTSRRNGGGGNRTPNSALQRRSPVPAYSRMPRFYGRFRRARERRGTRRGSLVCTICARRRGVRRLARRRPKRHRLLRVPLTTSWSSEGRTASRRSAPDGRDGP